jgi:hypothetical protein
LIEVAVTTAIGEEAVGANAHEARREHVEKESSQELVGCERERAGASLMTVVLVAEGDAVWIGVQEARIDERDAMGVAGKVGENALRTGEGGFAVDDPGLAKELVDERLEAVWITELRVGSRQLELAPVLGTLEAR